MCSGEMLERTRLRRAVVARTRESVTTYPPPRDRNIRRAMDCYRFSTIVEHNFWMDEELTEKYTGRALMGHWMWAARQGLLNENTAKSLRAACTQILGVLENAEMTDIRMIDLDSLLHRFQNKRGKDLTQQSFDTYTRRFRSAYSSYLDFLRDPDAWRPALRPRTFSHFRRELDGGEMKHPVSPERNASNEEAAAPDKNCQLLAYPFPLRSGCIVRLYLPPDLTVPEIQRLAAFLESLAIEINQARP